MKTLFRIGLVLFIILSIAAWHPRTVCYGPGYSLPCEKQWFHFDYKYVFKCFGIG